MSRLREALRALIRDGRATVVAILLLAVTIGTITAVYAIVRAVVLRPFPFADQDRLAIVWQRDDRRALPVIEVAHGEMADWRARSRSFRDLAVVGSVNWSLTLVGRTEPEPLAMAAVSASFFAVTGVAPLLGRPLAPADEEGIVPPAMVISHGLWVRRFGREAGIVGHAVPVKFDADGPPVPVEVAGVMPAGFDFPRGAEVWVPAAPMIRRSELAKWGPETALRWLRVFFAIGRLHDGVPFDGAERELTQVMRTADRQGGPEPPQQVVVTPIADYLLGPSGPVLRTLLAGAALMLLIACANVAGLQMARATRRRRALAIRAALGASRRHLVLDVVRESAIVTVAALAAAIAVAFAVVRALVRLAPPGVPRLDTVSLLQPGVVLFAGVVAFLTLALCALWPALTAARIDAAGALAHGAGAPVDPGGRRAQRFVVAAQIAIALTLLSGAALFLRSVRSLDRTALGFEPDGLLAFTVSPATDDVVEWNAAYAELLARVRALPHVTATDAVLLRPLMGPIGWDSQPLYPGQVPENPDTWGLNPNVNMEVVTPGYFDTMGIRLVRGRVFDERDTTSAPGVVIVGESAARRLWPEGDAIGQRLRDVSYRTAAVEPPTAWQTVVGIVEDVRYRGLTDVRLDVYVPASQSQNRVQYLMVRSEGDAAGVVASIRDAAKVVGPRIAISDVTLMRDVVLSESAPWRFLTRVFVAFATLAAALAAVGLGAVIALTVAARRRELAIRAALGAGRRDLRRLVLREAGWLVLAGMATGLAGALALGRGVAHVLIGVGPNDGPTHAAAAAVSAVIGLLATWLPARRAGEADPLEALREPHP